MTLINLPFHGLHFSFFPSFSSTIVFFLSFLLPLLAASLLLCAALLDGRKDVADRATVGTEVDVKPD